MELAGSHRTCEVTETGCVYTNVVSFSVWGVDGG